MADDAEDPFDDPAVIIVMVNNDRNNQQSALVPIRLQTPDNSIQQDLTSSQIDPTAQLPVVFAGGYYNAEVPSPGAHL